VRVLGGAALAALGFARIKKVDVVDVVQGRDLRIGEDIFIDNDLDRNAFGR
jgi:hypothetical protein